MSTEKLPNLKENFSEWYNQIVQRAELADYAPVRGCMVVRPYGWSLWENIQKSLDDRFKATGHVNASFPLLIPMSFFEKEKEHIEGFSPELAVVTIGGGEKLEEPLVIRPTSETIIGYMYSKWIKSYRDLPVLINQWANVVRWEMRTRLFLRTLEFFWQEGHTAHATSKEAIEETLRMLDVYTNFAIENAALPVIPGLKSEGEKFAGAVNSYSIEAMMGDTKALQSGTSHFLGQNFAKAFNIQYLDLQNQLQYCWTTSWGISTRIIGAIIMAHGDAQGLVLPPKLAPIQVVVIPIYRNDEEKSKILPEVEKINQQLHSFRVKVDDRMEVTPGYKFNDWEMRGVPLRIEIGPKDIANRTVAVSRRDCPGKEGKSFIPFSNLEKQVSDLLGNIHSALFEKARSFRDSHIKEPHEFKEFCEALENNWTFSFWCGDSACEAKVKELTKATTRCIPLNQPKLEGKCIVCNKPAHEKAYFAKAY
jgi:prolyl-tRNA synthetase